MNLDRQAVFNKVTAHLLTQNEKSMNGEACAYRSPNGLKCAIGALIPDSMYDRDVEGLNVHGLQSSLFLQKALDLPEAPSDDDVNFLQALQDAHDWEHPSIWRDSLKSIAVSYGLTFPEEFNEDLKEVA